MSAAAQMRVDVGTPPTAEPSPHAPPSTRSGGLATKRVTILSNELGNRQVQAYTRDAWSRCRDSALPWRERLLELQRVVFCTFQFPAANGLGRAIEVVMILTILVNACNLLMATFPTGLYQPATCANPICTPDEPGAKCAVVVCPPTEKWALLYVNAAIVVIFTIDYLARLLTVHSVAAGIIHSGDMVIDLDGHTIDMTAVLNRKGWQKTRDFFFSFMGLVDLFSVLPWFVNLVGFKPLFSLRTSDPNLQEMMHLSRALRLLKLLRYSRQTILFSRTLQASLPALKFFVMISMIIYLVIAGVIFFLERGEFMLTDDEPMGAFYRRAPQGGALELSPFSNLLQTAYWVVINTSSLKLSIPLYNPASKVVAVPLAYASVVLLALPISIVGSAFQKQYSLLLRTIEVPRDMRREESRQAMGWDDSDGVSKA